jgi:hypothetical protein
MLRASVLAVAICALIAACAATYVNHDMWPAVFWTGIVAVALVIERRQYGTAQRERPGPGWHATGERFHDDATGHRVEVWYEAATGSRRYVRCD